MKLTGGSHVSASSLAPSGEVNHFIEVQKGSDGHIWFMIHSGSCANPSISQLDFRKKLTSPYITDKKAQIFSEINDNT
jgi:hypothetical protein